MHRRLLISVTAALLLIAAAREARALWVRHEITPKGTVAGDRDFTIKASERDGLTQFEVTVKALNGRKLSPFILAQLALHDRDTNYGLVPVAEKRTDESVTYWFRVAPKLVPVSWFELHESAFAQVRQPSGSPKAEQVMGGQLFSFFLRDFADKDK